MAAVNFAELTPEQRSANAKKAAETRRRRKAAAVENPSMVQIGPPPASRAAPRDDAPRAPRSRDYQSDAAQLLHDLSKLAARPPLGEHWELSPFEANLTITGARMAFPGGADDAAAKLGFLAPLLPLARVLAPIGIVAAVFVPRALVTWQQWQQQKQIAAGLKNGTYVLVQGPNGQPMAVPRQNAAAAFHAQPPAAAEPFAPDPTSPREDRAPADWDSGLQANLERIAELRRNGAL